MWKKLFISTASGIAVFLAFPKFDWWPLVLGFGFFGVHLSCAVRSWKEAFLWGFWLSCVVMLGGFYWVTYVIHVFGYLPWSIAVLLFTGFCGFGALNFPFTFAIQEQLFCIVKNLRSPLWFALGFPALFVVVECFVPKLFPWRLGHCLYQVFWLNQIAELAGVMPLTFVLISWGSVLAVCFYPPSGMPRASWHWLWVPGVTTLLIFAFSVWRMQAPIEGRPIRVAIIQANIGNIDKVAARKGYWDKLRYINDLYESMTAEALEQNPDLIVWPETAMTYRLDGKTELAREIERRVLEWRKPLITGAYLQGKQSVRGDFNGAVLVEPQTNGVRKQAYAKNVLLAFGEYMPFGDWVPKLYEWFPQVSHFERGELQNPLTLANGTRLGVSICYEMILPGFMRKVARARPHFFVNLTNDSWFGPTSEPYLHGAISVFRSIEHRIPSVRSTNTGTSFVVDSRGRVSERTPVYAPGQLVQEILVPSDPLPTLYGRYGEWFVAVCGLVMLGIIYWVKKDAAISS